MKKLLTYRVIILGLLSASLLLGAVGADEFKILNNGAPNRGQLAPSGHQPFAPGQVIIKTAPVFFPIFSGSSPLSVAFSREYGDVLTRRILGETHREKIRSVAAAPWGYYSIVTVREGIPEEDVRQILRDDPLVLDASLNYIAHITETVFPDDPYFQYQYGLHNSAQIYLPVQNFRGMEDSDVDAPEGWAWTTGSAGVTVAVLDSGVAAGHEDLNLKIEKGYNFVSDTEDTMDDNGHGTFVASIAAAESNSGVGMTGVCWSARILPVKVLKKDGTGDYLAIAAGIRFAADRGAKVINLSLGGKNPSFILEEPCAYAFNKGCVIVASVGNQGADVLYPAAYDKYVAAVSASDDKDQWASFSNHGPQVDVAAPGVWVLGAIFDPAAPTKMNGYGWGNGTSFASPFVSGAAALLLSYKPNLSPSQIMDLIRFTADDVNKKDYPGVDDFMGYGRLNIGALLSPWLVR